MLPGVFLSSCLSRTTALLLLIATLGLASSARAEKLVTLVRGEGTGADRAATLVGHFLREELARNARLESLDLARVLGNPDRDVALKNFQSAEQLAEQGRHAYDKLELDAAEQSLSRVLSDYALAPAYVQDFEKVAENMMLLGATKILRGDEAGGGLCLESAIAVFPQVEPDPRTFNPAMRIQFAEAQARLGVRRAGLLSLSSAPGYAEAYVDGKFRGATPLTLSDLTPGPHYVRIEREGYRPWGKVVTVKSALETTQTAALQPTVHFEQFDAWAEAAVRRMAPLSREGEKATYEMWSRFGSQLGADLLALAEVRLDGERVLVQINVVDVHTRATRKILRRAFSYESDLNTYAREMAGLLRGTLGATDLDAPTAPGRRSGALPRDKAKGRDKSARRMEQPLPHAGQMPVCIFGLSCDTVRKSVGTTGIVLGAVGFGAATWQYLGAKSAHDSFRHAVQVLPATQSLRARGRAQATRGDILMGVGGVLVVAGVTTLLAWNPEPSVAQAVDAHRTSAQKASAKLPKRGWNFDLEPSRSGLYLAVKGTL